MVRSRDRDDASQSSSSVSSSSTVRRHKRRRYDTDSDGSTTHLERRSRSQSKDSNVRIEKKSGLLRRSRFDTPSPEERRSRSRSLDRTLAQRKGLVREEDRISTRAYEKRGFAAFESESDSSNKHRKSKKEKKKRKKKDNKKDKKKEKSKDRAKDSTPKQEIQRSYAENTQSPRGLAKQPHVYESNPSQLTSSAPQESQLPAPSTGKKNFFKQLQAQELTKRPLGTFHSLQGANGSGEEQLEKSGDWICQRRNCGTKNFKYTTQCHRCGAMKRLTEYR